MSSDRRVSLLVLVGLAALATGWMTPDVAAAEVGAPAFLEVARFSPPDAAAGDQTGTAVAVDGDTGLVGSPYADGAGADAGAVHVLARSGGAWAEAATLIVGAAEGELGAAVALDGDRALVGSPGETAGAPQAGAAYLFERDAGGPGQWGQVARLVAADGADSDRFGTAAALSGDTAIVGAWLNDELGLDAGAAYVFERDAGGPGAWGQVAKLTAADGALGDFFGGAVALSGDDVVVGASGDDDAGDFSGAAYVFSRDAGGPGAWGQVAKLTASDASMFSLFGLAVSLDGSTAVAGAPFGTDAGVAYVFERDAGGPGQWGEVRRLTALGGAAYDELGWAVAVSGDWIALGAPGSDPGDPRSGAVHLYQRKAGGPQAWGEVGELEPSDGAAGDGFGTALGLATGRLLAGAPRRDVAGADSGEAYVFEGTGAPVLAVSGTCPGAITVGGAGFTPGSNVRLVGALSEGTFVIPSGPCAGVLIELDSPRPLAVLTADGAGGFALTRNAGAAVCGRFLQALDAASCGTSGVAVIP